MIPGFIKIDRKIVDSDIWKKPPYYVKIWLWLLAKAAFKDNGNLKRGECFVTIKETADMLNYKIGYRVKKYSLKQARDFYEWSYEGNMIVTTKVTHGMIVSICNYDVYQGYYNNEGNNEGHTKALRRSELGHNIKKNVKNKNNIYGDSFEKFWQTYPKSDRNKYSKSRAFASFKKLSQSDADKLIIATGNYAKSETVANGFIYNPSRFIKDSIWKEWLNSRPRPSTDNDPFGLGQWLQ